MGFGDFGDDGASSGGGGTCSASRTFKLGFLRLLDREHLPELIETAAAAAANLTWDMKCLKKKPAFLGFRALETQLSRTSTRHASMLILCHFDYP